MPSARVTLAFCAGLVLAAMAAGWGAHAANAGGPSCQSPGEDPTFIDHPDLNQDAPQCVPSPDGRKVAIVRGGTITVRKGDESFEVGVMDYGNILWRPTSDGFAVADSQGSGQTNRFSFVDLAGSRPTMISSLREASVSRFAGTFQCKGSKWFANTWMAGWTPSGDAKLLVQEGHMSEGCSPRGDMIGVIGDPKSGAISRTLSAEQVRQEWCTPAQRREFGYCYDEREAAVRQ